MTKDIEIIRIGAADLPRVEALARKIWPECFSEVLGMDKIPQMLEAIYAPAVLERDMRESGHVFWLLRVGGRDAAFAAAYREGATLWIRKLYVLGACRGMGLGKRLIETARQYFPQTTALALNVNAGNKSAIAFYQSQGFVIEKKVPVVMGPFAFEDYIMRK